MKEIWKASRRALWWATYFLSVSNLLMRREISWRIWRNALTNYPAVVCGLTSAWVVDHDFDRMGL